MGCCFSKANRSSDIEMSNHSTTNAAVTCRAGAHGKKIQTQQDPQNNSFLVQGEGIVLGSCPLDCDVGRWEVKINKLNPNAKIQIGVLRFPAKTSTDLLNETFDSLNSSQKPSPCAYFIENNGHNGGTLHFRENDIIGIYWDQTDLPMLTFTLNGTILLNSNIQRVRPTSDAFPAICIIDPESSNGGRTSCSFIFDESSFQHPPIGKKFGMVICSTNII